MHQPYTLADVPQILRLCDRLSSCTATASEFINPAVWTSEAVELGVTALAVPTWLRDGHAVYCTRRRFYPELYHLG